MANTDLKALRDRVGRAGNDLTKIRESRFSFIGNQGNGAQAGVYNFVETEARAKAKLAAAEIDYRRAYHAARLADAEVNALRVFLRREVVTFRATLEAEIPPTPAALSGYTVADVEAFCAAHAEHTRARAEHAAALKAARDRIVVAMHAVHTAQANLRAARLAADGVAPLPVVPAPKFRGGALYDVPTDTEQCDTLIDELDAAPEPDLGNLEYTIETANDDAEEAAARRELAAE